MKRPVACLAALWTAAALAACSYPIRNDAIGPGSGPQYEWGSLAPGELQDTLVVVTASGGGTRATALTMSVLRAMDKIKLASGASLADEIDILSSVSGGSVTAGYFALYGAAGLPTLEKNFVRQDGMRAIIAEGLNRSGSLCWRRRPRSASTSSSTISIGSSSMTSPSRSWSSASGVLT